MTYTEKPAQSEDANQNMQQQHQELMFEEMQKILEEQELPQTKLLDDQEQNILDQQEEKLDQQIQLLEAELTSTFSSNNICSELLN